MISDTEVHQSTPLVHGMARRESLVKPKKLRKRASGMRRRTHHGVSVELIHRYAYSTFSINSEAFSSEFIGNREEMFSLLRDCHNT